MKQHVIIAGATSGIARAVAAEFARRGHGLILSGRDLAELERLAADLYLRYQVAVGVTELDALNLASHGDWFAQSLEATEGEVGGLFVAVGALGAQTEAQTNIEEARRVIETNLTACVSLCNLAANHFEAKGNGFICVLSSVAGDRGRQSNYIYGAAKAGLSTYLQGLRNRLHRAGVTVTTIKPGFVATKMTIGSVRSRLMVQPETVAGPICKAALKGKAVAYIPWFWGLIMLIIRTIPEPIFKRLRL